MSSLPTVSSMTAHRRLAFLTAASRLRRDVLWKPSVPDCVTQGAAQLLQR